MSGNASVASLSHVAACPAHAAEKTANDVNEGLQRDAEQSGPCDFCQLITSVPRSQSRDSPMVHDTEESITKDRGEWLPPR